MLLFSQVLIIALQVVVIRAVGWEAGPLAGGSAAAGWGLVGFATLYYIGNTYRAIVRRRSELPHWWSKQLIPIIFHYVLASFVLCWGMAYFVLRSEVSGDAFGEGRCFFADEHDLAVG